MLPQVLADRISQDLAGSTTLLRRQLEQLRLEFGGEPHGAYFRVLPGLGGWIKRRTTAKGACNSCPPVSRRIVAMERRRRILAQSHVVLGPIRGVLVVLRGS